jgi:DNA-binding MarR family transcriptional regulator
MSELASRLEGQGLAERRTHPFDGRRRVLGLTEAGVELLAEAADEVAGVEALCLEHVTEELCARLAELPPEVLSPVEETLRLVWE